MNDYIFQKIAGWVSNHHRGKLIYYALDLKLPIGRLIAHAIDKELSREKPFDDFPLALPSDEYVEYAYADQAGKILDWMKRNDADVSLDQVIHLRYDIGIPNQEEITLAFRECVEKKLLEGYKPKPNAFQKTEFGDNYLVYRIKGTDSKTIKKKRKIASEFQKYKRLEQKFAEGKLR